jgi:hypothetical protein
MLPRILEGLLADPRRSTYSVGVSLAAVGHLSIYDLFSVDINNPCREHQMMNNKSMVSLSEMSARNVLGVMTIVRDKVREYSMHHNCRSTSHLVASLIVREAESESRIHLVRLTNNPESGPGKEQYREGLRRCWTALASEDCEVPYGCSTLTNYLGPSLEFASIMACVSPAMKHYSSTSHSLHYASDLAKPYPNFIPRSTMSVPSTPSLSYSGMKRPRTPSSGGGKRGGLPPKCHSNSSSVSNSNASTPMSSVVNTPCTPMTPMTPADTSHMDMSRHMSTPPPSTPTNQDRQATPQVASWAAPRCMSATPAPAPAPAPVGCDRYDDDVDLPSASSAAALLSHVTEDTHHLGDEEQYQYQNTENIEQTEHDGHDLPASAGLEHHSGHREQYFGQEAPLPSPSAAAALISMTYNPAATPQSKRPRTSKASSKQSSPLVHGAGVWPTRATLDATRPRLANVPRSKTPATAPSTPSTSIAMSPAAPWGASPACSRAPSPGPALTAASILMSTPPASMMHRAHAAREGGQAHSGPECFSIEAALGMDRSGSDGDGSLGMYQQSRRPLTSTIEHDLGIHSFPGDTYMGQGPIQSAGDLRGNGEALIETDLGIEQSIEAELGFDAQGSFYSQDNCIDAENVLMLHSDKSCEEKLAAATSHQAHAVDETAAPADSSAKAPAPAAPAPAPAEDLHEASQTCYNSPLPSRRSEQRDNTLFTSPFIMFGTPPALNTPDTKVASRTAASPGLSPFAVQMEDGEHLEEWNLE